MDWDKLPDWSEAKLQVEKRLSPLGFKESDSSDKVMFKRTEWEHEGLLFTLICERSFYHCRISRAPKSDDRDLIGLLRFLKDDSEFLKPELEEANLSKTFPPDRYVDLFVDHLELIKKHLDGSS